jgi:hypothetical protein
VQMVHRPAEPARSLLAIPWSASHNRSPEYAKSAARVLQS